MCLGKNSVTPGPWFINSVGHGTFINVPHSESGIVPRSSLLGAGQLGLVGVLGVWRGWDNWVKGGANRVSLQAT
jgi:hypothetical protein